MKALIITVAVLLVTAGLIWYLFLNLKSLWHSAKRLGKEGARLARAPHEAAERTLPREADPPTPAPFHDFRRRQASEDRSRIRSERSEKRSSRLERATARWDEEGESPYAHFDRAKAKADYDARKQARSHKGGGEA